MIIIFAILGIIKLVKYFNGNSFSGNKPDYSGNTVFPPDTEFPCSPNGWVKSGSIRSKNLCKLGGGTPSFPTQASCEIHYCKNDDSHDSPCCAKNFKFYFDSKNKIGKCRFKLPQSGFNDDHTAYYHMFSQLPICEKDSINCTNDSAATYTTNLPGDGAPCNNGMYINCWPDIQQDYYDNSQKYKLPHCVCNTPWSENIKEGSQSWENIPTKFFDYTLNKTYNNWPNLSKEQKAYKGWFRPFPWVDGGSTSNKGSLLCEDDSTDNCS
jgi:hypothetical protein